jgi:hypothetical protein
MAKPALRRYLLPCLLFAGLAYLVFSSLRPRFPDEGNLPIELPALRVPSADCYEDEDHRILFMLADYDSAEMRFTWSPADGKGRVRPVSRREQLHFPYAPRGFLGRFLGWSQPGALVIAATPDFEGMPFFPRSWLRETRVYFGGIDEDGNVGAVPFQADPALCSLLLRCEGAVQSWIDPDGKSILDPLDPKLRLKAMLRLPAPKPGETAVEVTLSRGDLELEPDHEDVADKPVRVHIPADATVEEALSALIRLRLAGATAFTFD